MRFPKTWVTAFILTLSACVAPLETGNAPSPHIPIQRDTVATIADGYFEEYLRLNPVSASFIGDHRFDDRLGNPLSAAYREASRALEQRTLDALARLDDAALSDQDRLTRAVMQATARSHLDALAYPSHLLPFDQFNNGALFFAQMGAGASVHPFVTVRDYENFLSRMDDFVAWADQAIANMREGAARGIVQPRILMERTLPLFGALVVAEPEQSVFWQPVANMPATFGTAERARLTTAYRTAIAEKVVPAYRRLHDFVRDEYLPKCRDTVGWSALPGGRGWYAYLARANTTTNMNPEEVHQLGLEEVARIRGELETAIRNTGFRGTLDEFVKFLRTERRFYYRSADEIVAAHRNRLAQAMAAVPRLFSAMPKAPLEVRRIEAFREATQAEAEYYPPSADGSRPGIFYVNGFDAASRPNFGADALFLHEAIPGHHFQIALSQEAADLPRVRRFGSDVAFAPSGATAYAEGWGLYAETLGEDLGFYSDPYQKIGALFFENWRAARLVVDTGLHTKGWSRQQAIDYMLANTGSSEKDVVAEVERYIAWPGQALAYKIGQLSIQRLRAEASSVLGERFDLRAFHDELLSTGAVPLDVLERRMRAWIANRAAQVQP